MDWLGKFHIYVLGDFYPQPDNWIYHYQTLLSGTAALLAAVITVGILWLQMRASERAHEEVIQRRFRSAKANLPLSLSDLFDYGEACIKVLSSFTKKSTGSEPIQANVCAPEIPKAALSNLTELIEYSDHSDARYLESLLRFIQVQNSRFRSTLRDIHPSDSNGKIVGKHNLRHDVLDAHILLAMAGHIFPFARREVDHIGSYKATEEFPGRYFLYTNFDKETVKYVVDKLHRYCEKQFLK